MHPFPNGKRRQRDAGLGVVGDRLDPRQRAIAARRISRHRHDARVKTAKERGDKIQTRRIEQQGPLADQVHGFEARGHGPGLAIERLVSQLNFFRFAVGQIDERPVVCLMRRAVSEQIDEVRWTEERSRQVIEMHGYPNSG